MPWQASDAKRHKAGLTPAQAKTWAKVANDTLSRCQDAGESDCDGKAIRIANAAVDKSLDADALVLCLEATITKAEDSAQRLFGWASIAVRKDGTPMLDLQGDVIDIEDLEEAFYEYVKDAGGLNFQHDGPVRGQLIEAIVFTPDKLTALGLEPGSVPLGAWAGFYIPDAADYQLIKSLGFFMFSIEGTALREAL
jgi:Putative phage serine protease XkdF